ncbi:MAG TPA: hypothetical protein VNY29_00800 [Terriglobales bacterium]|jgi:hypothetical protein|nr:hypothetical protein [Terriglobales bacterium]
MLFSFLSRQLASYALFRPKTGIFGPKTNRPDSGSALVPFSATFKKEVGDGKPREHDGVVYRRPNTRILWMCYFDQSGKRIRESTFTEDWQEANKKLGALCFFIGPVARAPRLGKSDRAQTVPI